MSGDTKNNDSLVYICYPITWRDVNTHLSNTILVMLSLCAKYKNMINTQSSVCHMFNLKGLENIDI